MTEGVRVWGGAGQDPRGPVHWLPYVQPTRPTMYVTVCGLNITEELRADRLPRWVGGLENENLGEVTCQECLAGLAQAALEATGG